MHMKIDPDSDVIALIHYKGDWLYYAAPSEFWVLDWDAWGDAFAEAGYPGDEPATGPDVENDPDERFGIRIVDDASMEVFLARLVPYRLREDELTAELRGGWSLHHDWEEILHLFPKVLIDADRRRLSSIHVEGMSYEEYVPEGWGGDAEDFYEVIPPEHRFWIDGGKDYLREAIVQQADEQARRESRREGG